MTKQYYSTNNEDYIYDSIEDAITCVVTEQKLNPGEISNVWEGDLEIPNASELVPSVLDDIAQYANDNYGECAHEWPDVTSEQEQDLDKMVSEVVGRWANKHNLNPTFGRIVNEKEIKVRLLDEHGKWEYAD